MSNGLSKLKNMSNGLSHIFVQHKLYGKNEERLSVVKQR